MGRFFVQASQIAGDTVTLTGSDAAHIARVLRMTAGEGITVRSSEPFCKVCRGRIAEGALLPLCETCIAKAAKSYNERK